MINDPKNVETTVPQVIHRQGKPDRIIANFTRRSHYGWLRYDQLKVDHRYQRSLVIKKAIKMAHTWNPDLDPPWVVNHRLNGGYWIIDAQHRFMALSLIENRPIKVYCQIFEGLTLEEEARYFNNLDNLRDNLTAGASFTSAVVANDDPIVIGINKAAENAGVFVDYRRGPEAGNVRAYKTLQKIYTRKGQDQLTQILRICYRAWPDHRDFANASMMLGLEIFLDKYTNQFSERILIESLSKIDPQYIINQGRVANGSLSSTIYTSVARIIRNVYNKKRTTNRLPETF